MDVAQDCGLIPISVDKLKEIIHTPDEHVDSWLTEALKICRIPKEQAEQLKQAVRQHIREAIKRRGLPEEEWLIEALYRIFTYTAHITSTHLQQCIFKTDSTQINQTT